MDPSRRKLLATATRFSAALSVPAFQQTARAADGTASPAKAISRIGPSQVTGVRAMTERIADILDELGAGHARPMAAAFLVNTVGPWLRADATEPVRRDMLAAASDLTYLTGWMAMYEKAHGLGQTYYTKALKLADEAGDHATYCRTLRGMSLQASSLGHGRMALETGRFRRRGRAVRRAASRGVPPGPAGARRLHGGRPQPGPLPAPRGGIGPVQGRQPT